MLWIQEKERTFPAFKELTFQLTRQIEQVAAMQCDNSCNEDSNGALRAQRGELSFLTEGVSPFLRGSLELSWIFNYQDEGHSRQMEQHEQRSSSREEKQCAFR